MSWPVSDSGCGWGFVPATQMPNWRHVGWKIDFCATDGVDALKEHGLYGYAVDIDTQKHEYSVEFGPRAS